MVVVVGGWRGVGEVEEFGGRGRVCGGRGGGVFGRGGVWVGQVSRAGRPSLSEQSRTA